MISEIGKNRGFTLIEIMVSIAILSLGLILILQSFAYSLNALRICRNNLEATLLAEEKMSQMQIIAQQTRGSLLSGIEGESSLGNIEFKWEIDAVQDEEYVNLYKVASTTSWKEGRRKGAVIFVTYLRTPPYEER